MAPIIMAEATALSTNLNSVVTSVTSSFTTTDLISVVTICIGAVSGYVILWFGVRKVLGAVKSGVFRGKLRV